MINYLISSAVLIGVAVALHLYLIRSRSRR
jgi:hypothetical protein